MNSDLKVGNLRSQVSFCDSDRRVVLVSKDIEVAKILSRLRVVGCFPDTTDAEGHFTNSTFKIEVAADA